MFSMKKIILSLCICISSFFAGLLAASNISEATVHSEKIILGSGCFWGAEKGYESCQESLTQFLVMPMAKVFELLIER